MLDNGLIISKQSYSNYFKEYLECKFSFGIQVQYHYRVLNTQRLK